MGLITWPCSDPTCEGVRQDSSLPAPQNCYCGRALGQYGGTAYMAMSEDESSEDERLDRSPSRKSSWDSSSSDEESDSGDEWEPRKKDGSPRPNWYPGRRKEIKDRQTSPGGTLLCAICDMPIVVNARGKEEWRSKKGHLKETSPNVDHYRSPTRGGGGDWIERKNKMRKDRKHMALSPAERAEIEREVFNESPLRTTHMSCNCSRPKKRRNY